MTVGQFRAFVQEMGYETESQHNGRGGAAYFQGKMKESLDFTREKPLPNHTAGDLEPVTQVTWNDAWAYTEWLSEVLNVTCRLPTEAEWEYACLGKDREWKGMGKDFLEPIAVFKAEDVTACGTKTPNSYGLYDMLGNTWEWCSDYGRAERLEPGKVTDPAGPLTGEGRVHRGGTYSASLNQLRSAFRKWSTQIYRGRIAGFRVLVET